MIRYLALAAAAFAAPAWSTVVTSTYHLTASNFVSSLGSGSAPPFSSIDSTFSLTYDNGSDVAATALGSDLGLPSTYGANLKFAYSASLKYLTIGQSPVPAGNRYTAGGIGFDIANVLTNPTLSNFIVTSPTFTDQFQPRTSAISLVAPAAVPEPATWATMLGGFGLLGAAMRRRRTTACLA